MGKSQPALNYKIENVEYDFTRYPILGGGGVEESYLGASGDIVIKNIILGDLPKKRALTVNFELFDLNAETSTTPKLRGTDIPIITLGKRGKINNKIDVKTRATTREVRRYFAGETGGLDVQIRVFELVNVGSIGKGRMAQPVFEEQNEIFFTLNIDVPGDTIVQEVAQVGEDPPKVEEGDLIEPRNDEVDRYTTVEEASSRAKVLGCSGSHAHTVDGKTVYMPCVSMEEYERVTADTAKDFDEVSEQEDVKVKLYRSEPVPEDPVVPSVTRDVNVPSESDKIALQVALNESKRSKALNEAIEQLRVGAQDQINDLAGYSREERIRLSDIIIQTIDETIVQLQQEYNDDRQEDINLLYEVSINETTDTAVLSGTLPPGFVYIKPSLPLQESFTPVFGDIELPTEQSIELVTDDQIEVTEVDEQLDEISEEARLAQTLCDTEEDCDTLNY